MAQAQGLSLAHVDALHVLGLDAVNHIQQLFLARLFKGYFELERHVKVVFDRPLVPTGDEDHLPNACGVSLFHGVLDQRLVHHGQHLLRLRLRGREKAGTQACYGKDGFCDRHKTLKVRE